MLRLTGTGMLGIAILFIVTLSGVLWGCPAYNVYSKEQSGRAALAEAQSSRQIAVLEARARLESARLKPEVRTKIVKNAIRTAW